MPTKKSLLPKLKNKSKLLHGNKPSQSLSGNQHPKAGARGQRPFPARDRDGASSSNSESDEYSSSDDEEYQMNTEKSEKFEVQNAVKGAQHEAGLQPPDDHGMKGNDPDMRLLIPDKDMPDCTLEGEGQVEPSAAQEQLTSREDPPPLPPAADISMSLEQSSLLQSAGGIEKEENRSSEDNMEIEKEGLEKNEDTELQKHERQKIEESEIRKQEIIQKSKCETELQKEEDERQKKEEKEKEKDVLQKKEGIELLPGDQNPAEEWEKHWDEDSGFFYFLNPGTGESRWEPPGETEWFEAKDTDSGFTYLMNPLTGESKWKDPNGELEENNSVLSDYSFVTTEETSLGESLTIWEELKDPLTGVHYYYSNVSQSSQWEPPVWMDYICPETGAAYYCNTKTQESVWDRPKDFYEEAREDEDPASEPVVLTEELSAVDQIGSLMMETPRLGEEGVALPTPRLVSAPPQENSKRGGEVSMSVGYSFSKRPKVPQNISSPDDITDAV
mmetsp:Transcript_25895/g.33492  ORF Transcript_25895/g.33492 Transcript_25895/m.33492 type:complete len:501 (+) Transcript_25895:564-2066(+)